MPQHVLIVGTGLIGTSLGLALRARDVRVGLTDPSPTASALARDLGAGDLWQESDDPDLVVVAAPPDVAADVVIDRLRIHPRAVVTDVASVKGTILQRVRDSGTDTTRYVGSHPMAGRERSGAIAAQADLFEGRPWVVTAHPDSRPEAVALVTEIARLAGAVPVSMPAGAHDEAVAAVSHVPQVAASLVAARLTDLTTEAAGLAGQGVRDVTRIAAGDPSLWTQILAGNAGAVADVLRHLRADLDAVVGALEALAAGADPTGARATLAAAIRDGNVGRDRIPGKHGAAPTRYATVTVLIPDEPGTLGRLFAEIGEEGVNIEDVRMEHAVGRLVGVVDLLVDPGRAAPLCAALERRGWQLTR